MRGFRHKSLKPHFVGQQPLDWRAFVLVQAPSIKDLRELVSIGDRYVLSVGAHSHNQILLMDRAGQQPLTVRGCMDSCALLTFAIDSPAVVSHVDHPKAVPDAPEFSKTFRGTPFKSLSDYSEMLCEAAAAADKYAMPTEGVFDFAHRVFLRQSPARGRWCHYPWPESTRVWRGLYCYWSASLAVAAPARILNFWRALEAVTSREERVHILSGLGRARVAPVWTEVTSGHREGSVSRYVDAARALHRIAIERQREILSEQGTPEASLQYLYNEGRGKAAHADQRSLEYDMGNFIGTQLRDSQLLRYAARVALETAWDADG